MCNFFSFLTTDKGGYLYLNAEQRKKMGFERTDSHSKIAAVYYEKNKGKMINAYEYNPLTKDLVLDSKLFEEDLSNVKDWCLKLDFKTIVPELIIKPIINPFEINCKEVTQQDIDNLNKWDSVVARVRASVLDSVLDSVGDWVWASVRDSVWDSVWASVRASVWASVRDSVWDSVGASVRGGVRDSAIAYTLSFFNLDGKWQGFENVKGNPFQSCIDLWEKGLVPSFDGKIWRLHSKNGILYESEV